MTEREITDALKDLEASLALRDVTVPLAEITLTSTGLTRIALTGDAVDPGGVTSSFWITTADDVAGALETARAHVAKIPTGVQRREARFRRALAEALAAGREAGVDLEIINPLVAAMQALSENALEVAE